MSQKKSQQSRAGDSSSPEIPHKRKADTDCWNDDYEDFLIAEKTRVHPNYIKENETKAKAIKVGVLSHPSHLSTPTSHLKSRGKSISTWTEAATDRIRREKMRQRLAKRKNTTFTYSSEFQSQTLCPPTRMARRMQKNCPRAK